MSIPADCGQMVLSFPSARHVMHIIRHAATTIRILIVFRQSYAPSCVSLRDAKKDSSDFSFFYDQRFFLFGLKKVLSS
jgi:hypothetical protein